jgi:hypothetical protein
MTNDCSLKYLFDQSRLNVRQDRWMVLISEFDFETHKRKKEQSR